ncbi:MAG: TIGR02186 family protein [Novosphingobium sp.]
MKRLFSLLCLWLLTAAADPILVPEVSQHEVEVRQGFTGTELLLYGAILDPSGIRAGRDYDIVVILKGPTRSIVVREKKRLAGIWVNGSSNEYRSAPGYYAVASSRPIEKIVDARTAAIYEMGLPSLQLSPIGTIDPAKQRRFSDGLVSIMGKDGLYQQNDGSVTISEQVLYQARIRLPSSVPVGDYTAETLAVSRGRVVASATAHVTVHKRGFERAIADFAEGYGLLYGLLAVFVAVGMGLAAGRIFSRF